MAWLQFLLGSALLLLAAVKLAEYGDVIAARTRLGGMFIGTLLIAGATSLPELLTTINSLFQGVPNLAAGNLYGSNMFNMFLLGLLDMAFYQVRVLRQVALKHALSASLASLLISMAVLFPMANIGLSIGWVGLDSLALIVVYILGVRLLRSEGSAALATAEEAEVTSLPPLWRALLGFSLATAVLAAVSPLLVSSAAAIAEITGLGTSFIGITLVGMVTSLPEAATTVAAARIGAFDLAVGNLFGSNMFNMFVLGLTDFFFTKGRFLSAIDPGFVLVGLLGLLMTILALVNNLARSERRLLIAEVDALLLVACYFAGLYFFYVRQIGL
ncbi:MAG: sodium:calcium antiporter [Anaerolineae bacterium]